MRKELKKSKQKAEKEAKKVEETIIEPDEYAKVEEVAEKKVKEATEDLAKSVKTETDPNGNLDRKVFTDVGTEDAVIDENAEGFIGPKFPPRMSKEEIAVFYEEMMAKFKLDGL